MNLSAEQIQDNWVKLMSYISKYISDPRRGKLIEFYNKYQDRLIMMPASHKKEYHNAFPGGYVEHVLRVIEAALEINKVWQKFDVADTYTIEELVFSALNHDLGKMGDEEHECYIPQTDQWRKEKLGEDYTHNNQIEFMSVPDRGLHLLYSHGIVPTKNELLTIKLHDGLYDDANKPYLINWLPEQKPRTSLIFIVHQADLLAARVEFEREWLPKLSAPKTQINKTPIKEKNLPKQAKALSSVKSQGLADMLKKI
jgi:hypothetical protein